MFCRSIKKVLAPVNLLIVRGYKKTLEQLAKELHGEIKEE